MTMTRKHFELIARVIRDSEPHELAGAYCSGRYAQRTVIARQMADALRATNSQFNRAGFLTACGVED